MGKKALKKFFKTFLVEIKIMYCIFPKFLSNSMHMLYIFIHQDISPF